MEPVDAFTLSLSLLDVLNSTQTLVTSIDPNMVFGEGSMDLMVHEVTRTSGAVRSNPPYPSRSRAWPNSSPHGQMPFLPSVRNSVLGWNLLPFYLFTLPASQQTARNQETSLSFLLTDSNLCDYIHVNTCSCPTFLIGSACLCSSAPLFPRYVFPNLPGRDNYLFLVKRNCKCIETWVSRGQLWGY